MPDFWIMTCLTMAISISDLVPPFWACAIHLHRYITSTNTSMIYCSCSVEMGDTWANELAKEMEETAAIMLDGNLGKPISSCV